MVEPYRFTIWHGVAGGKTHTSVLLENPLFLIIISCRPSVIAIA